MPELAPLVPPIDDDTGHQLIHTRNYEIQVLRVSDHEMLARGAVRDLKPGGLYLTDDPDPLPVHHMVLELRVAYPSLEILSAQAEFRVHPHDGCPDIVEHYGDLAGVSIARGFTRKVRELFGGPLGCTHTTALLQALAPAVVQATFSMQVVAARQQAAASPAGTPGRRNDPEAMERNLAYSVNTCHMWAEDGELVARVRRGERPSVAPVFVRMRYAERGIADPPTWEGLLR